MYQKYLLILNKNNKTFDHTVLAKIQNTKYKSEIQY